VGTRSKSYSKLSRKARREQGSEQGLAPAEAAEVQPKPKPGPLSVDDVRMEMLRQAGFSLDLMKKSIDALERNLTSDEPFAQLTAAKLILQLSNSFPSKQARTPEKMEITVRIKPFAQMVESTAVEVPALPVEEAEVTGA
jgi:hypothetical protein